MYLEYDKKPSQESRLVALSQDHRDKLLLVHLRSTAAGDKDEPHVPGNPSFNRSAKPYQVPELSLQL